MARTAWDSELLRPSSLAFRNLYRFQLALLTLSAAAVSPHCSVEDENSRGSLVFWSLVHLEFFAVSS